MIIFMMQKARRNLFIRGELPRTAKLFQFELKQANQSVVLILYS